MTSKMQLSPFNASKSLCDKAASRVNKSWTKEHDVDQDPVLDWYTRQHGHGD